MDEYIKITGAREHNLQNVDIDIPKNKLTVITGLSGSGKSSLAFDTLYAEGKRRYVESLSSGGRPFMNFQNKPDFESITGLSPAIAINQKGASRNPRSTVGTATEIYDYIRLLFARVGVPHSPVTGLPIKHQTPSMMVDRIMKLPAKTKIYVLAPVSRGSKGEFKREIIGIRKRGYGTLKVDGIIYEINDLPRLDKNQRHDIEVLVDKIVVDANAREKIATGIERALKLSNGLVFIEIVDLPNGDEWEDEGVTCNEADLKCPADEKYKEGDIITLSEKFSCPVSGFVIEELTPRLFSFNSPFGACKSCNGLGKEFYFDVDLIVPNEELSIKEGAIIPWSGLAHVKHYEQILNALALHFNFNLNTPFNELSEDVKDVILYGSKEEIEVEYEEGNRTHKVKQFFEGVIPDLERKMNSADSEWVRDELAKYQNLVKCHECGGYRLNEQALSVKIAGLHIGQVTSMSVEKSRDWFSNLYKDLDENQNKIAEKVVAEVIKRLDFMSGVGLSYLTLDREFGSLAGGESQRIKLASQIGSGLSGVIYVLDEPSIGLHQSDNHKLIDTIKKLRDLGNTVVVVEHDEDTIRSADYIIDVGPGAGVHGGKIIAKGTATEIINNPDSITGLYLSGKKSIAIPKDRRKFNNNKTITIKNATTHNLKNVDVDIPLGLFCAVSGVSGGGKSSLIIHTLYKALYNIINNSKKAVQGSYEKIEGLMNVDKIIQIDQSPIGRTPRSNPCTYVGALTLIREIFLSLPESRARGYKINRFSFNVKGGRCEACSGDGVIKIEMHFLPDVYVTCDVCKGKRYDNETLEIKYRGKSIADILEMTVEEAVKFFEHVPYINEKFIALNDVGLGYMKLGQSATTLSGGEAQRIKLARELGKKATGNTIYILDEPTTGLHLEDINKLLNVLHKLVDQGNSLIVIEHNLDVIKTADWVIDLGPVGGDKGGYIVAQGTPEEVSESKESLTSKYLKEMLSKS